MVSCPTRERSTSASGRTAVLATALEAGVDECTAELADERDDKGRCLVASNGYHQPR